MTIKDQNLWDLCNSQGRTRLTATGVESHGTGIKMTRSVVGHGPEDAVRMAAAAAVVATRQHPQDDTPAMVLRSTDPSRKGDTRLPDLPSLTGQGKAVVGKGMSTVAEETEGGAVAVEKDVVPPTSRQPVFPETEDFLPTEEMTFLLLTGRDLSDAVAVLAEMK